MLKNETGSSRWNAAENNVCLRLRSNEPVRKLDTLPFNSNLQYLIVYFPFSVQISVHFMNIYKKPSIVKGSSHLIN